ncbi:MAG: DUF3822 family protein [Bacteroidales bacterium]|nr:DUF3822 family protein [Bacteroidales bacterium]
MTSFLYPYIQGSINLNSKNTDNYIMTIQHSLDGLSFVVFDTAENKFVALKHYHISEKNIPLETLISELQEKESWDLNDFKSVNILIDNNINTFVPKDYFQETTKEKYLSLLNINNSNVLTDSISEHNIINVYALQDNLNFLNENIRIYHSSSILIKKLLKEFSSRNPETRAFVNVKNNSYELIIINNDKLIFHNYFNFNTKEDFLYFILFTFEQLNIDNESIPLYFIGFIEEKSPVIELCSRYIRNIRFFNRDNDFNYINELNSIPYYYYYTLYSFISCE